MKTVTGNKIYVVKYLGKNSSRLPSRKQEKKLPK